MNGEIVAIPSKPGQRLQCGAGALLVYNSKMSQSLPNQVNDFNLPVVVAPEMVGMLSQSLPNQVNDFNNAEVISALHEKIVSQSLPNQVNDFNTCSQR